MHDIDRRTTQADDDDAVEFFREVVEPTVAEFLNKTDDRRRGCLACLCLASMADHYFHARPGSRRGCSNSNAFRKQIAGESWSVGQIIGIANATKHVERRPGRVGYQDISVQDITCGNLRCGWPIIGTKVMIHSERGGLWLLSNRVEAAAAFWRDKLALHDAAVAE